MRGLLLDTTHYPPAVAQQDLLSQAFCVAKRFINQAATTVIFGRAASTSE
jgi:hypothetical protein